FRTLRTCRSGGARLLFAANRAGSVDGGDVGTDQCRRLLVDAALAAVCVVLLEMRERSCRGDRVQLVVAMVVERHVHKRVICEPKNDVAHVARLGIRELVKDPFDSSLVLVGRLSRPHRVTGYQSLLHGLLLSRMPERCGS